MPKNNAPIMPRARAIVPDGNGMYRLTMPIEPKISIDTVMANIDLFVFNLSP